jgi:precorrin-6A/cobalt-precorrin-6A reductase
MMQRLKVLILGGTTEASALARALAGDLRFEATLSLAGRTRAPRTPPIPFRIGGFGGVDGLVQYLRDEHVDVLIDATHPFAAQMSRHAAEAARIAGVKLLAVCRPAWRDVPGDHWTPVPDMAAAVAALGLAPRRVFLTIGQKELAPFRDAPQHAYVIRSVDAPDAEALPPDAEVITARGPFVEDEERRLLAEKKIDVIVTKNSGGTATEAKLAAARGLGIPVIMVERPARPEVETVARAEDALDWLARAHRGTAPSRRGV